MTVMGYPAALAAMANSPIATLSGFAGDG